MTNLQEIARLVVAELQTLISPVQLLSVNPSQATGEVSGRFRSSGLVFDYSIKNGTVSYKPVGAGGGRTDSLKDHREAIQALSQELKESRAQITPAWSQQRRDGWDEVQTRLDRRCRRPDGSFYGTSGQCRTGKESAAARGPARGKVLSAKGRAQAFEQALQQLQQGRKPKAKAAAPAAAKPQAAAGGNTYKGYDLTPPRNDPYEGNDRKVAKVTKALRDRIAKEEPAATRMMIDLAEETGGKLEGLAYRLKAEKSLGRKIENEYESDPWDGDIEACANSMSDVVRYTMKTTNDKYTDMAEATVRKFQAEGWVVRSKNYWEKGQPYRGMNIALTSPEGLKVELQLHTPQSLYVKHKTHPLYEKYRVETDNKKRRQLFNQMLKYSDQLIPPWGTAKVGGKKPKAKSVQKLQQRAGEEKERLMQIGSRKLLGFQTAEEAGLVRPRS